jgi:hypothetical protein
VTAHEQTYYEDVSMLARAVLHVLGETDDPDAVGWARRRAAVANPSEAIEKFAAEVAENRRRAAIERAAGPPLDALPAEFREAREQIRRSLEAPYGRKP